MERLSITMSVDLASEIAAFMKVHGYKNRWPYSLPLQHTVHSHWSIHARGAIRRS